ncbi:DUF1993 family protein [Pseudoduganella sp. FT26W]|uniref:DUF1993 family protein n=1 Tax=Duganella aquatilis TaxID=2666082 RepID=A0A844D6A8_9BURK|nr:DUF1993 domain-containing protein [Duganella aquatilis]MRW84182.1 DUF1993 family protein [Duganella aquatilis]
MSTNMSSISVPVFVRALKVLSTLLSKGEAHAVQHGIAPAAMLGARLAPDMLPLSAQVQRASDSSKFAAQRLSGGEGPRFADDETTFAQLQQRIANTITYLESVDTAQLDAGGARAIALSWPSAEVPFTGESYLLTVALPNFFFHIVTAYNILRNQGVKVGKLDYLGPFGAEHD